MKKCILPTYRTAAVSCLFAALICRFGGAATVTSTADDGPGSLRRVIAEARPGETIKFSMMDMLVSMRDDWLRGNHERRHHWAGPAIITLTSGELLINKDLSIAGPGANLLTVERSAHTNTPEFRVFNVHSGTVAISGLTVSNGRTDSGGGINNDATLTLSGCLIRSNSAVQYGGGGIYNAGTLTMTESRVCANSAPGAGGIFNGGRLMAMSSFICSNSVTGWGGGIYNDGTLALTNSAVGGNSAVLPGKDGDGGGIFVEGTVTLDCSTVTWNSANSGGGIYVDLGTLELVRSTVCSNTATGGFIGGGGLANEGGFAIVQNSTISGNAAGVGIVAGPFSATAFESTTVTGNDGGGIYNLAAGFVTLRNTILADNNTGADLGNSGPVGLHYGPGRTESAGFNLVGSTNGLIITGPSDEFNVTAGELRLGPLRDNGGPTFTHQLLCGSVAINAGDNSDAPPTDQRGLPRIVGGTIDIGAYESGNQSGEVVNGDGCSVFDLCPCGGAWRNHGEFVACVERATAEFVAQGLMTEAERGRLISAAARSDCAATDEHPMNGTQTYE